MFIDASLWVFVAFLSFIGLVGKRTWQTLQVYLDQRAERIQNEIQEAKQAYLAAQQIFETKQQLETQIHLQTDEMAVLMEEQIQHLHRQNALEIELFQQQEQRSFAQRLTLLENIYNQDLKDQVLQRAFEALQHKESMAEIQKTEDQLINDALWYLDHVSLSQKGGPFIT